MVHAGDRPGFALEALPADRIAGKMGGEDLDSNSAI
jgi:hypothetical protein